MLTMISTMIRTYWTTGRNVSARSSFPVRFYASGFKLPYFLLISYCMQSFSRQRTKSVVPSAARSLYQNRTASNTARLYHVCKNCLIFIIKLIFVKPDDIPFPFKPCNLPFCEMSCFPLDNINCFFQRITAIKIG